MRIGISSKSVAECYLPRWQPTADYLAKAIPTLQFEIVPLKLSEVRTAVAQNKVDFILTNPTSYVELQHEYGISAIATRINRSHLGNHTFFGGVIFTLADNPDIFKLEDLRQKDFMAVEKTSFGGWHMVWREMREVGFDPFQDLKLLSFGGTHDAVVFAVQNHRTDAGAIRTDTLERMAAEGHIDLNDFRIVHTDASRALTHDFAVSTRLYPEWPMARLAHTPIKLAEQVAQALRVMPGDSPAAQAAQCAGWAYPLSYQPVHECLQVLQLGPYDPAHRMSLAGIFQHYRSYAIAGAIALLAVLTSAVFVIRLNADLSSSNSELVEEVHKRKAAETVLKESEQRLQTILDSSVAGTVIIDPQSHRIVDANAIALEMYGAGKQALVGRLCHETFCQTLDGECPITDKGADIVKAEKEMLTADGKRKNIFKTVAHVTIQGRDYLVDSFIDITSLKKAQLDLERALDAAQSASEAKTQFLANMSHEIRTPMNGVLGMNSLLMETDLNDEQREYVDTIKLSADALMHIINDTLDFSKIEKNRLSLEITDFDLPAVLADVCQATALQARGKGLAFFHSIDSQVPNHLRGDAARLRQILLCLTTNAVKFTSDGEIVIQISRVHEENGKVRLRFSVKDTGIGIAAKLQEDIFRPFFQEDGSDTRKYGGTGLGLAIARHLVTLMNGEMGLESEPGKGATFWFTVLLEKQHPAPDARVATKPGAFAQPLVNSGGKSTETIVHQALQDDESNGPHILVVEDNTINQKVVLKILGKFGCRAQVANNGREALETLQGEAFDAVLMDLQMPVMDGFEATSAIRNAANKCLNPAIPIIALTASTQNGDREKCLKVGLDDYLAKPVNPNKLMDCINHWLEKAQANDPSATAAPRI